MGDLEERIFKQNVPGRWSAFDDRSDIRGSEDEDRPRPVPSSEEGFDEAALLEEARSMADAEIPEPIRRKILAERLGRANTGAKGVLADYKQHKMLEEAQRDANAAYREAVLRRMAEGAKVSEVPAAPDSVFEKFNANGDSEDDDSDDDEFMQEYRQKRLKELKQSSTLPVFDGCKDVDTSSFIDEVEKVDPRVIVVVHLYESSVQSCVRVNRFLEEIAHTHEHIKFLRMQASTNMISVDIVTLPILTFYRGGETFLTLAGLTHELGGEFFTKDDLEWAIDNALSTALNEPP